MSIESLPFERRPRNSIANNLDKINELVDWVNLDTHLYASATGERVTVDDASSLKGLTVDGRSVQDGTPTPDAPVAVEVVEGRNLLPKASSRTVSGVTFTVQQDGSVLVDGTATANIDFVIDNFVREDFEQDSYFLSGCPSGGSYNTYYLRAFRPSPWKVYTTDNGRGAVLNMGVVEQGATVRIIIGISKGTVCDNLLFRPQLEAGSTATPYVPYGSIGILIGDTATPIDLQGNTLASLPDGTRDELHVDSAGHVWIEKNIYAITLNGGAQETWTDGASGKRKSLNLVSIAPIIRNVESNSVVPSIISNRFVSVSAGASYASSIGISQNTLGTVIYINLRGSETVSMNDWIDWLAANPVTAYYPLATPQTIYLGYIDPPAIPNGSVVTISASLTPEFHLEWWVDDGITALVDDLIAYIDYKTEG